MFHENSVQVINRQAAIGAKWVFMSTVIYRAFQLVVTVLLARLLSVEDFGLMGYAYIFMSLVALFQDLGIGQALIQRKENFEEAVNVAFITMLSLYFVNGSVNCSFFW
jgi:O-antigen/teichoic acid export membrane protein